VTEKMPAPQVTLSLIYGLRDESRSLSCRGRCTRWVASAFSPQHERGSSHPPALGVLWGIRGTPPETPGRGGNPSALPLLTVDASASAEIRERIHWEIKEEAGDTDRARDVWLSRAFCAPRPDQMPAPSISLRAALCGSTCRRATARASFSRRRSLPVRRRRSSTSWWWTRARTCRRA